MERAENALTHPRYDTYATIEPSSKRTEHTGCVGLFGSLSVYAFAEFPNTARAVAVVKIKSHTQPHRLDPR